MNKKKLSTVFASLYRSLLPNEVLHEIGDRLPDVRWNPIPSVDQKLKITLLCFVGARAFVQLRN